MADLPPLLGVADLAVRWSYSRQGVHQLVARSGFPAPALTINQGRTKAWALADVEAYERDRPELGDAAAKRRKQVGYLFAVQKPGVANDAG